MKSGLLLLLVTVLQVSGRYKNVEPDFIENVIKRESEALVSSHSGSRIVSGWEAQPGQHPHHAALRMVSPTGGVSGCGGSIVSKEWVITAAHCTAGRLTVVVRGGVVSLTDPEYIFETTEYYNHPKYNNDLPLLVQPHDISLVKVPRPFVYSRLLKAIRVQPRADAYRDYDGEQVYASGHGRTWTLGSVTEVLRWVYLRAISNESCGRTFVSGIIIDTSICARFFNVTSQSTCQGDSGGPLVHVGSDGVPTLVGVTSFVAGGDFGCHSGLPAGFIRPGPYLSWFEEVTGIDFENLQEDDDSAEVTTTPPVDSDEDSSEESTATSAPPTTASPEESEEDSSEEKPEPEDSEEDDSDSSESNDDEMKELLKRLEVKVKVKVRFNKYIKKQVEKEKQKQMKKLHHH
uniref:Serine protease 24 n=1 Tax=Mamestra configurata TaxID=174822 RepID=C9W8F4_9NEOP|nr:serine protease 24 [Mamestra configurata]